MNDYKALYARKKLTADEVAARVENGWLIGMDAAIGQTPAIIDAICRRAESSSLSGVRVQMLLDTYPYAFFADDHLSGRVTGESWLPAAAPGKPLLRESRIIFPTTTATVRAASARTMNTTRSVSLSPPWTNTGISAWAP